MWTRLLRLLEFLAESQTPGWLNYVRKARPLSVASYRLMHGVSDHCGVINSVIDVGANRGQFIAAARHFFPRAEIIAFEPIPYLADALRAKFAHDRHVQLESSALGDSDGRAVLNISQLDHASSLLSPSSENLRECPEVRTVQTADVSVTTLDRYFGDRQLTPPILLKLDVQGFEENVLRGGMATLTKVDFLILETSIKPMYEGESSVDRLCQIAKENGFQLLGPVDVWRGKSGIISQVDLLWQRSRRA